MDRHASRHTNGEAARRWAVAVLGVVALVMAGRAAWLSTRPLPVRAAAAQDSHKAPASAALTPAEEQPRRSGCLSVEEYAAIAGLCPTALDELPESLLPPEVRQAASRSTAQPKVAPPHELTAAHETAHPVGRLTGIRLASREPTLPLGLTPARVAQAPPPEDGWLVSPEAWFSPEDRAATAPSDPPAEASQSEAPQPSADMPAPADEADAHEVAPVEPTGEADVESSFAATPFRTAPWPTDAEPAPAADSPYPNTNEPSRSPTLHGGFDTGPSFAPPGVATSEAETQADKSIETAEPEPAATEPAPLSTEETPNSSSDLKAEVEGPTWQGPFDSVVPGDASRFQARDSVK